MRAEILDYMSAPDLLLTKLQADPHPSSKLSVPAIFESTFPQGKALLR